MKISSENFLRLPVQDIYKFSDKRIIVGRVESGKIKLMMSFFLPSNEKVKIKSFEEWPLPKKRIFAGDCVGLTLSDQIFVDKGNLASHPVNLSKINEYF